ncbi:hypothetical protein ACFFUT_08590 [Pseudohalocynthiibacter aestuariivivens]|uniref:Apea-like HEPN domain-containing protein n=1 Tax=Pseudohalocynthiibacter aestuariivivens TaxID=1591409 RepID=A0ABV5JG48_9RHOB|nr:hypothetical protein [Pseudohalocynthiibacter aestuariivivens]MBS9717036.1 hypothetical protein [Pseudohalocynthiibacter aestuariivivens]
MANLSSRKIDKTLKFVMDELVRYHELSQNIESIKSAIKNDGWLYEIPLEGNRKKIIGKAAHKRLAQLSETVVSSEPKLVGRVRNSDFLEVLKVEFGKLLLKGCEYDDKEFIDHCIEVTCRDKLVSKNYYIPCLAPNFRGMTKFSIGPVTFYDKKVFLERHGPEISKEGSVTLEEFEAKYDVQNWIAHVRISGFCEPKAQERAYLSVRMAIAAIKSRLRLQDSKWLGTSKQMMPKLLEFFMSSSSASDEKESIFFSWHKQFILNAENDVVMHLLSDGSRDWFILFGSFLAKVINEGRWRFLEQKLITAMIWLDIGNSPASDAERTVAFSNCLEALYVSSDKGIKQQIVKNSKVILEFSGWKSDLNGKVGEFYSKRGSLVHGEDMPLGEDIANSTYLGKYLTDVSIEGFFYFAAWLLEKHSLAKTKEHDRPFNGPNSFTKALSTELPLFIQERKKLQKNIKSI